MKIQAAITVEQGVKFVVVCVKKHILDSVSSCQDTIQSYENNFGVRPVVLMAQDSRGTPVYYGRKDISNFLSRIDFRRLPWKEYSMS